MESWTEGADPPLDGEVEPLSRHEAPRTASEEIQGAS